MRIYSHDDVVRLLGLIYEAALAPDKWQHFLNELGAIMDAHGLNLSCIDASRGLRFVAHARFDPGFVDEYRKYYGQLDPWLQEAKRSGWLLPGVVDLGEKLVPPATLKQTEFYCDFARHSRFIGGIAALFESDATLMALSISQYDFGQFGAADIELVNALLPHLRRATQVHQKLDAAEGVTFARVHALDCVSHGIFLLSAAGKVLYANRAANEILRASDGLRMDQGELRASTPLETSALRAAIAFARRTIDGAIEAGSSTLTFSRCSGRPMTGVVAPLTRAGVREGPAAARVAVFVTDPDKMRVPEQGTLARLFDLTPAEARLVQGLTAGYTLEESAGQLGISVETARKRLRDVFVKTDTHRQSDLVRLVLTSTLA
jgi:DNA-binding CsgD family transcriptional regulator